MPVEPATLTGFLAVALAIVISPGPDTMLILRSTLTGGHRMGLATVAGIQIGMAVHTIAAVLGLTLIIFSSPLIFRIITIAGAAYLGWLALKSFRAGSLTIEEGGVTTNALTACRDAMLVNLLNPKVILLFIALLPNFVDPILGETGQQLAFLGLVLITVNIGYQVPLSLAASAARRWLGSPAVQHGINYASGTVLLTFAVIMLAENIL